jgi:hypothetical protein
METDSNRVAARRREKQEAVRRLLDLVAGLGNVSEACRRLGMDRSAWYRLRKATGGDPLAAPAPRRNAASPELAEAALRLCLEYPEWGCDRLAHYLTLKGSRISSPTVQKILIRAGLGRVGQREEAAAARRRDGAGGNA